MAFRFLPLVIYAFFALSPAAFAETREVQTQRMIIPDDAPLEQEAGEDPLAIPTQDLPPVTEPKSDEPLAEPAAPETPVANLPEVHNDLSELPEAVRQTRQNLLDAAATGDINNLRSFIELGERGTSLSLGGIDGDPIEFLKSISGDDEGQEILAIMTEILEAGYVHLDAGTDSEIYVWPYFFSYPLAQLTPPQRVQLFRILTAGDLEESREFGSYIFYRAGIRPDGTWSFFLAGD